MDKEFCTKEVKNFILNEGSYIVEDYIKNKVELGEKPNYSDLLRTLNGTTKGGVNFASSKVVRSEITKVLLDMYKKKGGIL